MVARAWRVLSFSLLCILLVSVVAWVDWKVGWEISLFVFYAFPIAIASWRYGSVFGGGMALLCSVAWWVAQEDGNPYETRFGLMWASFNRSFYFGVVVFATVTVRKRRLADAARIRALEERRQLERDIVSISEHEHQRIGQDLHDGLCQQLAAIGCATSALAQDLSARGDPGAADAELIERSIRKAVTEARELAHGILPVHVDREGLPVALGHLASTMSGLTGVDINVHEHAGFRFDDPVRAMHLYRIAQEAVANAIRHGRATKIDIFLRTWPGGLEMVVADNGIGLVDSSLTDTGGGNGMGLRTMRYRAQSLGDCDFSISGPPRGGTSVRCFLRQSSGIIL